MSEGLSARQEMILGLLGCRVAIAALLSCQSAMIPDLAQTQCIPIIISTLNESAANSGQGISWEFRPVKCLDPMSLALRLTMYYHLTLHYNETDRSAHGGTIA